jgi:hypothetical protein
MDEPSVLDYIKAKLTPWRGRKFIIPTYEIGKESSNGQSMISPSVPFSPDPTDDADDRPEQKTSGTGTRLPKTAAPDSERLSIPWRILLAVFLSLAGQGMFEPPDRKLWTGLVFYGLAAILAIWSFLDNELKIAPHREASSQPISLKVRHVPLYMSVPFILLCFLAFGGNEFTPLNIFLWLAALYLVLAGLWVQASEKSVRNRLLRSLKFLKNPTIRIKLTPWFWLMVASTALIVFFRFYWLEGVPGEMFSDHAEKLLDVGDILAGKTSIFFPRNTGREAFQMYLTASVSKIFGTGLSFMSLKIGTALAGLLTLPYIYLLGKEVGNRWVGLLAFVLAGIAYWPNVISRVGLRFTLYALFTAPTLYYLIRGLRTSRRNYFLLSGLALGLGLHGYSPFRFVPLVVVLAVGLYLLHGQSKGKRLSAVWALAVLAFIALLIFLPLFRYILEDPQMFSYRMMSRLGTAERGFPGAPLDIFFKNLWKAEVMFFLDNGGIWVHSIPGRPALDVVSASMYFLGTILLFGRYLRKRNWVDILLLLSVPLLMMPSILSLAFPDENPSLNRTAGALVPVFVIAAIGMQGIMSSIITRVRFRTTGKILAAGLGLFLITVSSVNNYSLVFENYNDQFMRGAWNTSQMGGVIRGFSESIGDLDSAYVVPYPHWVDTRLVGIRAGYPAKDYGLWPEDFGETLANDGTKIFLIKPEDSDSLRALKLLYPFGIFQIVEGPYEGRDFIVFTVPSEKHVP